MTSNKPCLTACFGSDRIELAEQRLVSFIQGSDQPELHWSGRDVLTGADGALVGNGQEILIAEDLLSNNQANKVARVLLEEIGHWLDAATGTGDSLGDEGHKFAEALGYHDPSGASVDTDDHGQLKDGRSAEFSGASNITTVEGWNISEASCIENKGDIELWKGIVDQAAPSSVNNGDIWVDKQKAVYWLRDIRKNKVVLIKQNDSSGIFERPFQDPWTWLTDDNGNPSGVPVGIEELDSTTGEYGVVIKSERNNRTTWAIRWLSESGVVDWNNETFETTRYTEQWLGQMLSGDNGKIGINDLVLGVNIWEVEGDISSEKAQKLYQDDEGAVYFMDSSNKWIPFVGLQEPKSDDSDNSQLDLSFRHQSGQRTYSDAFFSSKLYADTDSSSISPENLDSESRSSYLVPKAGAFKNGYYHLAFLDLESSLKSDRDFYVTVSTRAGRTLVVELTNGILDDVFSTSALGNAEVPFGQDIDGDGKTGESLAGLTQITTYPDGVQGLSNLITNDASTTLWKTTREGIVIGTKIDGSVAYTPIQIKSGALLSIDRTLSGQWEDENGLENSKWLNQVNIVGVARLEGNQGWRLAARSIHQEEWRDEGEEWQTSRNTDFAFFDVDLDGLVNLKGVQFGGTGLQEYVFNDDINKDEYIGIKGVQIPASETDENNIPRIIIDLQDGSAYISPDDNTAPSKYIPIFWEYGDVLKASLQGINSNDDGDGLPIAISGDPTRGFTLVIKREYNDDDGETNEEHSAYSIYGNGKIEKSHWDIYLPSWEKTLGQNLDEDESIGPRLELSDTDPTWPRLSKDAKDHWYLSTTTSDSVELVNEWGDSSNIAYTNNYAWGSFSKTPWAIAATSNPNEFEMVSLLSNRNFDTAGKPTSEWISAEITKVQITSLNGRSFARVLPGRSSNSSDLDLLEKKYQTDFNGDGLPGTFEASKLEELFKVAGQEGISLWRGKDENSHKLYICDGSDVIRIREENGSPLSDIAINLARQASSEDRPIGPSDWVDEYLLGAVKNVQGNGYTLLAKADHASETDTYRMISIDSEGKMDYNNNLYWQKAKRAVETTFQQDLDEDGNIAIRAQELRSIWVNVNSTEGKTHPQPLTLGTSPEGDQQDEFRTVKSASGVEIMGIPMSEGYNTSDGWYLRDSENAITQLRDFYGRPLTSSELSWAMPFLIRDLPEGGYEIAWQRVDNYYDGAPSYIWAFLSFSEQGIATSKKRVEFSSITSNKELGFGFDFNLDQLIGAVDLGSLKVASLKESPIKLWADTEGGLYLGSNTDKFPSIAVRDSEGNPSSLERWGMKPVAARLTTDSNGNQGYEVVLQSTWDKQRGMTVFLNNEGVYNEMRSTGIQNSKWYNDLVSIEQSFQVDFNDDKLIGYGFNDTNSVEGYGTLRLWSDDVNGILFFGKNAESLLPITGWTGDWYRYDQGTWKDTLGLEVSVQYQGIDLNDNGQATYVYRQTTSSADATSSTWFSFDVDLKTGREIKGSWSQTQRPEQLETRLKQDLDGDGYIGPRIGMKEFLDSDSPATVGSESQQFLIREADEMKMQPDKFWISTNTELDDEDDKLIVDWNGNAATVDRSWNGISITPIAVEKEQWGNGYQLIGQQGKDFVLSWLCINGSSDLDMPGQYTFGGWSERISASDTRRISALEKRFKQDLDGNGEIGGEDLVFDFTSSVRVDGSGAVSYPTTVTGFDVYRNSDNVYAFRSKVDTLLQQTGTVLKATSGLPARLDMRSNTTNHSLISSVECVLPATGSYKKDSVAAVLIMRNDVNIPTRALNRTSWLAYELDADGIIQNESKRQFDTIQELEEALEVDLNNDRFVGVLSDDLSPLDIYEIDLDNYALLLEKQADGSLWIQLNENRPTRIKNVDGTTPSFKDIIALSVNNSDVSISPVAIKPFRDDLSQKYQILLEYASEIKSFYRTFQVSEDGIIDWSTEGYSATRMGLEQLFDQDLDGDGNVADIAADNTQALNTDTSLLDGHLLRDTSNPVYWIKKTPSDSNPLLIKLKDGTIPSLENSGSFAGTSYSSLPYLVEKESDGNYLLLIKDTELNIASGISTSSWQSLLVDSTGNLDPASIEFDTNETLDETKFNQDVNDDGIITNNSRNRIQQQATPSFDSASNQASNIVAVSSSSSGGVVNLYVSSDVLGDNSQSTINARSVRETTAGMLAQAANENGLVGSDITALSGLIDFDVVINNPANFGSIVQVNFSLPEGEASASYFKFDPITRSYQKLDFDPITGEGAKVEDGFLKVFIRDNGKYDDDNRLGYVKDPAFLASLKPKSQDDGKKDTPQTEPSNQNANHQESSIINAQPITAMSDKVVEAAPGSSLAGTSGDDIFKFEPKTSASKGKAKNRTQTLVSGGGGFDIFRFEGSRSGLKIKTNKKTGVTTLIGKSFGSIVLREIESITFADGSALSIGRTSTINKKRK